MLKILQTAAKQVDLEMDTTGFGTDPIANSKLAVVTKMVGGRLAGIDDSGKATLALEHATASDAIHPVGWIINDAGGFEYYNKAGMASKKVAVLPLVAGTLVETDQVDGLISTYADGDVVYVDSGSGGNGLISDNALNSGTVGAIGRVVEGASMGFVRVLVT